MSTHAAPTPLHRRPPAWVRPLAWVQRWRLDAELAAGADPSTDPILAHRAAQLSEPAMRHQLATGIRDLVERAERPRWRAERPRYRGAVAPIARGSVRAERAHLLELADRLDAEGEAGVRGVAAARLLLTDGASPLWLRSEPHELEDAVDAALTGLGA